MITKQKTKLRNARENNMSTDIMLSRAQITTTMQSREFLGVLLSKLAVLLMKVAVSLAKNILAPLGITAAASAINAGIQKKMNVYGCLSDSASQTTTLIISNE